MSQTAYYHPQNEFKETHPFSDRLKKPQFWRRKRRLDSKASSSLHFPSLPSLRFCLKATRNRGSHSRFEYGGRNFRHSEIANKQGHDATARMRRRRRSRKSRIPGE
jgi:hypothetical protein